MTASSDALLLYNPAAGARTSAATQLARLMAVLEAASIQATPRAESDIDALAEIAAAAAGRGVSMVIACGGDGTIESVANGLVNTGVPLGILPAGTRNNVARSLGIPLSLQDAARLLRDGRPRAIGTGLARCGQRSRWFLETFTVGIFSALYPHADAMQKGDFVRAVDLFRAFLDAPSARMHLAIDDGAEHHMADALAVMGVNMPLTGANFRLAPDIAFDDEHLDIFVYDRLDKLDLLVYGLDVMAGIPEDPTIHRLRARHAFVRTDPPLPIMADGFLLGEGEVDVRCLPHSLHVIMPAARV